jgi:hypothetical protein
MLSILTGDIMGRAGEMLLLVNNGLTSNIMSCKQ